MEKKKFLQLRLSPLQYSAVSFAAWQRRQSLNSFVVGLLCAYCEATGIFDELAAEEKSDEPAEAPAVAE